MMTVGEQAAPDVPAMPEPTLPDNIIVAIQEYGDARVDGLRSAARLLVVVKELRQWAARLAAAAPAAMSEEQKQQMVRDMIADMNGEIEG